MSFRLRAPNRQGEASLQKQVAAMLRAYLPDEVWWTASLSGVKLTPGIAAAAKRAGMNRGAPDLSFILPDGETRYIELKAEGGVLTPEQKELAKTLGARFVVCRSWAEVREAVTDWLARSGLAWLTERESLQRVCGQRAAA